MANRACLYIATKLGDLRNELVIIGGLVPSLIVRQAQQTHPVPTHVGTMDVDLGLAIDLLDAQKYQQVSARLRDAGFQPDVNQQGRPTNQRWVFHAEGRAVHVDFLIPPANQEDRPGSLRNLEQDFAAIITPGLQCAFRDRESINLQGKTLQNEHAERPFWVCGPGAFVVLKGLAFGSRGANKDAYDLVYVLQNYDGGVEHVADRLRPLMDDPNARGAIEVLRRDFTQVGAVGPMRYAAFLGEQHNDDFRADAASQVRALLSRL